ncbi:dimethylarginine dimethylaminohydrolase family protein [Tanticharoenia sakaeratensis]|uniref:Amidinotransferase n=1 Tax=Tanticharoenia sakaeratensis NBRC 103193 TaxID=1231623 RepID=A0A0D6MIR7_9PROT|nr:arginine deiminase-related protein [Tanticharoenia sakaeratensis]GAN53340.1 amidinotransferase [Tanticharoenia sakaeratensis NBRC 103193]GBQ20927.1 amidinotransferase [Tanticharoenia sakaeratensis NBRC 103193]
MAPTFLLVDPTHYDVSYAINPWMQPDAWARDPDGFADRARRSFNDLKAALERAGARIIVEDGAPGLPDMVFPANGGIVFDGKAVPPHFRFPQRQGETERFRTIFRRLVKDGVLRNVAELPDHVLQEGAGDCLWDQTRGCAWGGFGQRSDEASIEAVSRLFSIRVEPLRLHTERFYHLDTCFHVLPRGEILYYPPAFDDATQARIAAIVPESMRIVATDEDAARFCVNAVAFDDQVIMAEPAASLRARLEARGYTVHGVELTPFMMSGGGAYCMTLRLDRTTR